MFKSPDINNKKHNKNILSKKSIVVSITASFPGPVAAKQFPIIRQHNTMLMFLFRFFFFFFKHGIVHNDHTTPPQSRLKNTLLQLIIYKLQFIVIIYSLFGCSFANFAALNDPGLNLLGRSASVLKALHQYTILIVKL